MADRWTLACLSPLPADFVSALLPPDAPVDVLVPPTRDPAGMHAVLPEADLVLGDFTHALRLRAPEVEVARRLVFVQQPSVGVDGYDLEALTAAGVALGNCAGANSRSVAEWCVGAAFALARHLVWADAQVRAGGWPQLEVSQRGATELGGKRVGVVGFGAIGSLVARLFAGLGCEVAYWSRRRREPAQEHGAAYRELDDLCATSDVLVVVLPLADGTRGLLDERRVGLLPSGALLVDAGRGGVVDEAAVAAALDQGRLGGAAFDVFAAEPLPATSALRASDRVLLSPHAAGASSQATGRILQQTADNLLRVVRGEAPVDVVNGVVGVVRRR